MLTFLVLFRTDQKQIVQFFVEATLKAQDSLLSSQIMSFEDRVARANVTPEKWWALSVLFREKGFPAT